MNFSSLQHLRKIGLKNFQIIMVILFHCFYHQNNKETHVKIANLINSLGIIPTKLAQWCAYFCNIQFDDNIFVNSFKYLQTECNENKNLNLTEKLKPFNDILYSWEKHPISVASIAQIYRGKLKDGTDVVIKIKHDNISKDIQTWKDILNSDTLIAILGLLQLDLPVELNTTEFFENLKLQTDFNQEVSNLKKFQKHYKNNPFIKIPEYYAHDENVIIMEYVSSMNFQEIQKDLSKEENRFFFLLARILYQDNIFIKDIIHMDLHNGNWGIDRKNKRLVLYDFGWVLHDQAEFKKFFICAHLSRKKTLNFIVKRYNISDKEKELEDFILTLSDKIDTLKAINLILKEFQDDFKMDNFMFCMLSFCVFMGSISEKFENFESYIDEEMEFLKSNNVFIPLCSLIEKFKDPELRVKVEEYLVN